MRLRIYHTTRYIYPTPAMESHNEVRLMPLSDDDQTCLDFRLTTSPTVRLFAYDLPSGRVHYFDIRQAHSELRIHSESLVVTHRQNPFLYLPQAEDDGEFYHRESIRQDYAEYLAPTERVQLHPETERIAAVARRQASGAGTVAFLLALTRQLYRVMTYAPGSTHVDTSIQNVLEQKSGVCQDFAHLMLAVCRRQHIPARYVSGYLYTGQDGSASNASPAGNSDSPEGGSENISPGLTGENISPGLTGENASSGLTGENTSSGLTGENASPGLTGGDAMHAWVECLLPDNRWHGFDPTNNLLTNDYYVKVHTGRDYGDVAPIRGIYRGPFAHTLDVSVRVLADAP